MDDLPEPAGYEFNAAEDAVVARTGRRILTWGFLLTIAAFGGVVVSLATLAESLVVGVSLLIAPVLFVLAGLGFVSAGWRLGAVVRTEGNDLDHLMSALEKLGTSFFVLNAMSVAAGLLLLLAFLVARVY